ncbi:hypothetical protein GCM10023166_17380 [Paeniglutamicibacter cryotolerans]|uniref:Uncharacterized protein n=1 Tax=Paeniglutamicibacter cryotolerans TaxID=670079 RepID=A0A839QLL3_9MICC|nr:hypothetical protein [Paeniglutamicibacter cryotolerans]
MIEVPEHRRILAREFVLVRRSMFMYRRVRIAGKLRIPIEVALRAGSIFGNGMTKGTPEMVRIPSRPGRVR